MKQKGERKGKKRLTDRQTKKKILIKTDRQRKDARQTDGHTDRPTCRTDRQIKDA